MAIIDEMLKRAQANKEQQAARTQNNLFNGNDVHERKAWRDWKGAVNSTDLVTGQTTRRYFGPASEKNVGKDNLSADLRQAIAGAMQRQEASYKNAGASLLIGVADLLNGKKEYQPKVGSWLWRMKEGAEADMGAANKFMEDSKAGHGKAYGLVMDLTTGAVDLASDALLTAATGGASIGGKLAITAGLGAMGARSFGSGEMEAEEKGLSRGQAFLSGLKSATIEMLTEKIGGPFEKAYGRTALGRTTKSLAERLSKNAGMEFALKALGNFASEGGEEVLSDILNPLADKLLRLDNGEGWQNLWTADGFSQMAYDGLVGGLLGFFGGAVEGLSPEERAKAASDGIDNAIAANQQGKSIANELENDTDGLIAQAISNTASQDAAEAKPTSDQQITPETPEVSEKAPSVEFNAKTEANTQTTTPNSVEAAPQMAPVESPVVGSEFSAFAESGDKISADDTVTVYEDGDKSKKKVFVGKDVRFKKSSWPFIGKQVGDTVTVNGKTYVIDSFEPPAKTGADILAERAKQEEKPKEPIGRRITREEAERRKWEHRNRLDAEEFDRKLSRIAAERGLPYSRVDFRSDADRELGNSIFSKDTHAKIEKAVDDALAVNGVSLNVRLKNGETQRIDPRSSLEFDPETKKYVDTLGGTEELDETDSELGSNEMEDEDREKLKRDLALARLLDSVDSWLDKNGSSYIRSRDYSGLQKALASYIGWKLSNSADLEGFGTERTTESYYDPEHQRVFSNTRGLSFDKAPGARAIEAGEATNELLEAKREEAKSKSQTLDLLGRFGKQKTRDYARAVLIGNDGSAKHGEVGNLVWKVFGANGQDTTQVAADEAEAIRKHHEQLTQEARAAEKRVENQQKDEYYDAEAHASQFKPEFITGSNDVGYYVAKKYTSKGHTTENWVVTELAEDGYETGREADIFTRNAENAKEAVEYAIAHPELFKNKSAEGAEGNENGKQLLDNNGTPERPSDNSVSRSGGNSDEASGNPQTAERENSKAEERPAKAASRTGEKISLREAVGLEAKDGEAKTLSLVDTPDYSPEMSRSAKEAEKVCGKKVTFVRGEWPSNANLRKTTLAATSKDTGEIVVNLDAFESRRDKSMSLRSVVRHEAFHALVAQDATLLGRAIQALKNVYGEDGLENRAREYAWNIMGAEDAEEYKLEFGDYPEDIYNEVCADAFGGTLRFGQELFKAQDAVRNEAAFSRSNLSIGEDGENLSDILVPFYEPSEEDLSELGKMNQDREESEDAEYKKQRKADKEQTNAKEYAYNKKLEEESGVKPEEELQAEEDKASDTFGKDIDKVVESAKEFGKIKTDFDEDAFRKSEDKRDKATAQKLDRFRELFKAAVNTGDVESLFKFYENLESDPDLGNFFNEDVMADIDTWRRMSDEHSDDYNEKASPFAAARAVRKMAHKFAKANEYHQILKKMNETLSGSKSGMLRKLGKSKKLSAAVARALVRWQINPDTVFKMVDAFDKGNFGEGYKLAKELQTAHRKKYEVVKKARKRFNALKKMDGYNDFIFGKQKLKDHTGREWDMRDALTVVKSVDTIRSTSGKKLGGSDGFAVQLSDGNVEYIDMNDVEALQLYRSLQNGLSDVAKKLSEISVEAFDDVKEPLRDKYFENNGIEIEMVGDADKKLSKEAKEKLKKRGYDKAIYSPLAYISKDGQLYQFDVSKQVTNSDLPKMLRKRSPNGGAYIYIRPYTDVVAGYFEQVANYLAYSSYNEKLRGLAKGSSYTPGLASSLSDAFGKDMGDWYKNYVEDLKTYNNEDDTEGINSLLRKGRQQLQQGALLFSVSVPMKQISSYWAASGILHPDSLLRAYRPKFLKALNKSDAATMLASRAMDNLEPSAAEAAKQAQKWLGKLKYSSEFIEVASNAINIMDFRTVSNLLTATEYDVLKYQFNNDASKIGTAEYNAAVEELFQDVVDRSQPNFDKQMRAEYGRTDNELIRMTSMFRSQQTQNLNLLAVAIGEYNAAKGTKNQAKATETLRNTIAGQAASAFSLSVLSILADMLLHRQKKYEDEDKKLDGTKVLSRLGINAIEAASGTLWFGDTVAKWAIDQLSGGETNEFYGVNLGIVTTMSNAIDAVGSVIKSPTRSNAKYAAGQIATMFGIPLNNAYAFLNSAIMYAKDAMGTNEGDYDDILKYLDAQAKAAKKEEEKKAKAEAKASEKSGADILAEAASQKPSQSELNTQEEQKESKPSGYMAKPYNALVGAGMSSQQSKDTLAEMDTDGNNSVKQSEMIAYYKAHPEDEAYVEAMWNSYGYKTTWEAAKKKAG